MMSLIRLTLLSCLFTTAHAVLRCCRDSFCRDTGSFTCFNAVGASYFQQLAYCRGFGFRGQYAYETEGDLAGNDDNPLSPPLRKCFATGFYDDLTSRRFLCCRDETDDGGVPSCDRCETFGSFTGSSTEYCRARRYETLFDRANARNSLERACSATGYIPPTPSPTETPTTAPTSVPTRTPTNSPTAAPTLSPTTADSPSVGFSGGDPHFKTWNGTWWDFQKACDLVLLSVRNVGIVDPNSSSSSSTDSTIDLDVHVRTTARYDYSYIESVAVKIGETILEVSSYGFYSLDGISNADLSSLGAFSSGGVRVLREQPSDKIHVFSILLGDETDDNVIRERIVIQAFKDMVSVKVESTNSNDFASSVGLLGNYVNGTLLARDGVTIMTDLDSFGQEWQVQPGIDGTLFQTARVPQYPQPCSVPDIATSNLRRRLGEGEGVSQTEAEEACARQWGEGGGPGVERCIYDVMAMGDLDLAVAGSYEN